ATDVGLEVRRVVEVPLESDAERLWASFSQACGTGPRAVRWPTLVFTYNDMLAKNLILALERHGVRVPQDVSIIGFDDIKIAKHSNPPLASLAKPRTVRVRVWVGLLCDVLTERCGVGDRVRVLP